MDIELASGGNTKIVPIETDANADDLLARQ